MEVVGSKKGPLEEIKEAENVALEASLTINKEQTKEALPDELQELDDESASASSKRTSFDAKILTKIMPIGKK